MNRLRHSDRPIALSLVIPAFNEASRLPAFLDAAIAHLREHYPDAFEILVIDDGSDDDTAAVAARTDAPVRVIRSAANRGKGAAVRTGMLAARGARRLFADADGATPIDQERRLAAALAAGADVAIGSRAAPGGARVWVRDDDLTGVPPSRAVADDRTPQWHVLRRRHVLGRVFAWLVSAALGLRFADTQCGFKLFTAAAATMLFTDLGCDGWAFDVEVLAAAERRGLRVAEIPVTWHETARSKVRLGRAGVEMLWTLWSLRRRAGAIVRTDGEVTIHTDAATPVVPTRRAG